MLQKVITVVLLMAMVITTACSSTATIHTRSGESIEREILGTTGTELIVREPETREKSAIPVQTIDDVDHPGVVSTFVGLPIFLGGAFLSVTVMTDEIDGNPFERDPINLLLGLGLASLGATLFATGLNDWVTSSNREDKPHKGLSQRLSSHAHTPGPLSRALQQAPQREGMIWGASWQWRF